MPGLHRIQVVDRIKMVDVANVKIEKREMQRRYTDIIFFRLPCHCHLQQSFNLVNVLISKFFTGQTD